jgi:hypothetical protein
MKLNEVGQSLGEIVGERYILEIILVEKVIAGPVANYEQVVKQLLAVGWQQTQGNFSEN